MSSTPVFEAASISITSGERPAVISQAGDALVAWASPSRGFAQLTAFASRRADAGLAGAARAAEEVGVRQPSVAHRVQQRPRQSLPARRRSRRRLPDDICGRATATARLPSVLTSASLPPRAHDPRCTDIISDAGAGRPLPRPLGRARVSILRSSGCQDILDPRGNQPLTPPPARREPLMHRLSRLSRLLVVATLVDPARARLAPRPGAPGRRARCRLQR